MRGLLWIFVSAMALLALVAQPVGAGTALATSWSDLVAYNRMGEGFRREAVELLRQYSRFEQHFLAKCRPVQTGWETQIVDTNGRNESIEPA